MRSLKSLKSFKHDEKMCGKGMGISGEFDGAMAWEWSDQWSEIFES